MYQQEISTPDGLQTEPPSGEEALWPLKYHHTKPEVKYFNYRHYQNSDGLEPTLYYCRTKSQSEQIAKKFIGEPLLGFDMEWSSNAGKDSPVQDNISVIQLACEDKIALFHIAAHIGKTAEELIAPSLRTILESPDITKTGVNIKQADFSRLSKYLDLRPRAAFELSHLYRLVKYGSTFEGLEDAKKREVLVNLTTKVKGFADQADEMLGFKLFKGSERTSEWHNPKNLSKEQKKYAADDAYAGFMLYHCMNWKRLQMDPIPPLPLFADSVEYSFPSSGLRYIRLEATKEGDEPVTVEKFYGLDKLENQDSDESGPEGPITTQKKEPQTAKLKKERPPLDPVSEAMFIQLSARRKVLASAQNIAVYKIATNAVLEGLAKERPLDLASLLLVKGIGKVQQEKYGAEWLEVISLFLNLSKIQPLPPAEVSTTTDEQETQNTGTSQRPATPIEDTSQGGSRGSNTNDSSPDSSPAFGSPLRRSPQLHTELSFTFAKTNLDSEQFIETSNVDEKSDTDPDESFESSSENFGTPPSSRPSSQLKRKRSKSMLNNRASSPTPDQLHVDRELSPAPELKRPFNSDEKLFRNKLEALKKRVAMSLTWPPDTVAGASTIDDIVYQLPRTAEELDAIPGAKAFSDACVLADKCLWTNVDKWSRSMQHLTDDLSLGYDQPY
jgi:ribonuclease D